MKISNNNNAVSFKAAYKASSGKAAWNVLSREFEKKYGNTGDRCARSSYGVAAKVRDIKGMDKYCKNPNAVICATDKDEALLRRALNQINHGEYNEGFRTVVKLWQNATDLIGKL